MISKCAANILAQLGGNKFLTMTGAKIVSYAAISLLLQLPRNPKGIKWVRVILDEDDTYIMDFAKLVNRMPKSSRIAGVYVEQLQEVFTANTGLYTSL